MNIFLKKCLKKEISIKEKEKFKEYSYCWRRRLLTFLL